jgi:hypothetical protein
MTISSVGSATNAYQTSSTGGFNQLFNDFKGMAGDIQSGDLTSAQNALTAFENDLQSNNGVNPLSRLFSNNSTLSTDLQNLQSALQSNNSNSAQSAFQTLIQDMQSAMSTHGMHRHHHHHRVNNDGDGDDQGFGPSATSAGVDTDSGSGTASTTVGSTLNVQA